MQISLLEITPALTGLYCEKDKNILTLPIIILNSHLPHMSQFPFNERVFLLFKHHIGRQKDLLPYHNKGKNHPFSVLLCP